MEGAGEKPTVIKSGDIANQEPKLQIEPIIQEFDPSTYSQEDVINLIRKNDKEFPLSIGHFSLFSTDGLGNRIENPIKKDENILDSKNNRKFIQIVNKVSGKLHGLLEVELDDDENPLQFRAHSLSSQTYEISGSSLEFVQGAVIISTEPKRGKSPPPEPLAETPPAAKIEPTTQADSDIEQEEIVKDENIKRFTYEQEKKLKEKGYVIFDLEGMNEDDLYEKGYRPTFKIDGTKYDPKLRSIKSQVALFVKDPYTHKPKTEESRISTNFKTFTDQLNELGGDAILRKRLLEHNGTMLPQVTLQVTTAADILELDYKFKQNKDINPDGNTLFPDAKSLFEFYGKTTGKEERGARLGITNRSGPQADEISNALDETMIIALIVPR